MSRSGKTKTNSGVSSAVPKYVLLFTWFLSVGFAVLFVSILHRVHSIPGVWAEGKVSSSRPPQDSTGDNLLGPEGARVAIMIEDLGEDLEPVDRLLAMEIPVSLAVLPYRKFSDEVARKAFHRGKEVLLHVPLEPQEYPMADPGPGCLLVSMGREEIQLELAAQIGSLPHCVGVHPHMGSLFVQKLEPLDSLVAVLREQGLFLVDSGDSSPSGVTDVARTNGVPFVQRTHLLDERREEASVIRQLCRLADFAVKNGWALGIGHPYPETLAALPRAQAAFREKHVTLVPVSGLIPRPVTNPLEAASALPNSRVLLGASRTAEDPHSGSGTWLPSSSVGRSSPES